MRKLIAVLEDNRDRVREMTGWLDDRLSMYDRFFTDDPGELIAFLAPRLDAVLAVSLDHDLHDRPDGNTELTGMPVAEYLAGLRPRFPVLLHTTNGRAAETMTELLRSHDWWVGRVIPFNDLEWVGAEWYPALKRAIRQTRQPAPLPLDEPD